MLGLCKVFQVLALGPASAQPQCPRAACRGRQPAAVLSSQAWFWAVLLGRAFISMPLEGLRVPFPGGSRNHPIVFLLQNKEHAGTQVQERQAQRVILQLPACLCSVVLA